eukprot:TRINITY_DN20852_c0_g1_i1.p1 TRINITY_DN20852_c0_g1~~TRINITY_DN20852_c0_g1_i1.p1  ORF type:complete len:196 (-),score=43.56 TRINITY_DN20852_c0_g1_i1:432-980(-)
MGSCKVAGVNKTQIGVSCSLMAFLIFILVAVAVPQSQAQLVGSRGVVILPAGFVYHDNETLDASRRAAEYAKTVHVVQDHQVAQQKLITLQKDHLSKETEPKYANSLNKIGRQIPLNSVLSFEDSRLFNPPVENRLNVQLEEVEKERANGKIRLLPGQGVSTITNDMHQRLPEDFDTKTLKI